MQIYYHATTEDKAFRIIEEGIKPGVDNVVYMCTTAIDAAKFLMVRGIHPIYVFKFKIYKKEEHLVSESFDHSEAYFKCKAYTFKGTIEPSRLIATFKYD